MYGGVFRKLYIQDICKLIFSIIMLKKRRQIIMDVKKAFYPILLVLILVSSLYIIVGNAYLAQSNITVSGVSPWSDSRENGTIYDVVQRNGTNARYNLTIALLDDGDLFIIANITLPSNLTYELPNLADVNGSKSGLDLIDGYFNQTGVNDTTSYRAHNESDDASGNIARFLRISFYNNNSMTNGTETGVFSINVTAIGSDEATDYRAVGSSINVDLVPQTWMIKLNMTNGSGHEFNLTTYIDYAPPRITALNITDGNGTIFNDFNGTVGGGQLDQYNSRIFVNFSDQQTALLSANASSLTVTMTVNETNMKSLNMYYLCNSTVDETETSIINNASLNAFYENVSMSTSDISSPFLYTGAIDLDDCMALNGGGNNITTVFFQVADKAGWVRNMSFYRTGGATEQLAAFRINITNNVPAVLAINLSDTTGGAGAVTLLAGSGQLNGVGGDFVLSGAKITINLLFYGANMASNATMYYIINSSVSYTSIRDLDFFEEGNRVDLKNITDSTQRGYIIYNGTLAPDGIDDDSDDDDINDTNTSTYVNFLIVGWVNDTGISLTANASNNSYTYRYRGAFGVDGQNPSPTLTAPSDTTIDVQDSIAYKCSGSDGDGSGVSTCDLKFTRPDGTTVTYTTCNSKTINAGDTGQAGTYTVDCKVTDTVGNAATATSKTFTVLHHISGDTGGGGGGAGGAPAVDIDLTTADSVSVGGYKGNDKTFTLGGAEHTITFTDVGDSSVTLTIESNPIVVTLAVGETKSLDLNNDGINDLDLTLNSISSGKADVTMKKLAEGAAKLVEEEKASAAEQAGEEGAAPTEGAVEVPSEEVKAGTSTGVIIAIVLIIIVLAVVGYLFIRKRS